MILITIALILAVYFAYVALCLVVNDRIGGNLLSYLFMALLVPMFLVGVIMELSK